MKIISTALSAAQKLGKFAFKTKPGIALTAGAVGMNIGESSSYAGMHGGMGHLGMYGRGF